MLFDIEKLCWDNTLLKELNIPKNILPKVYPSSFNFGVYNLDNFHIPITGIVGDQQSALFGQVCFKKGEAKNTYGTGCFMLMNTGEKPKFSKNGLLTTIAWGINNKVYYALEGSVFVAGSAIQWLRDGLQIINNAKESEKFANEVKGDNPVYVVPVFAGLAAPYWDMYARGAVFGLSHDTGKNHLIKATLDLLAYQTKDILDIIQKDNNFKLTTLKVDVGACTNNYLMQFQSNILNTKVERPKIIETTIMGVVYLSGICVGLWKFDDIVNKRILDKTFSPNFSNKKIEQLYNKWKRAVERSKIG